MIEARELILDLIFRYSKFSLKGAGLGSKQDPKETPLNN